MSNMEAPSSNAEASEQQQATAVATAAESGNQGYRQGEHPLGNNSAAPAESSPSRSEGAAAAASSRESATCSWGSDKDRYGRVIGANATVLELPCDATDADIALIAQLCKQLQWLDLSGCNNITDAGLLQIAALQMLQALETEGTAVTDAGFAAFLAAQEKEAASSHWEIDTFRAAQKPEASEQGAVSSHYRSDVAASITSSVCRSDMAPSCVGLLGSENEGPVVLNVKQ